MSRDILTVKILKHVVEEYCYERMLDHDCRDVDNTLSYENFLAWNKKCIEELSSADIRWLGVFCDRLNKIGMMDMEDCGVWKADSFYYDKNKNIVIVHPR